MALKECRFVKMALTLPYAVCYNIACDAKRRVLCEGGGIGRRARLRGVWLHRASSSLVPRTI